MIKRPSTELNINVYRERTLDTFLEFVQGDTNTNILNINLLNGKIPINITNLTITITFKKADNNVVVGNVTIIDATQGKISYSMGTQEIAYPGKVIATIEMYEGQARFTSCQFMFMVRAELNNGSAIPSQTIYPVFEQMIANGNDVIAGCQTATNNANTAQIMLMLQQLMLMKRQKMQVIQRVWQMKPLIKPILLLKMQILRHF
jgi:hypothetical protein